MNNYGEFPNFPIELLPVILSRKLEGTKMVPMKLAGHYMGGVYISRLDSLRHGDTGFQYWENLRPSTDTLKILMRDPNLVRSSKSGKKLLEKISSVLVKPKTESGTQQEWLSRVISDGDVDEICALTAEYNKDVCGDFDELHCYFIPPFKGHDMDVLLGKASDFFETDVWNALVKETQSDIQSAARSLAFDLFTACGFYILRATEREICQLIRLKRGGTALQRARDWGAYVRTLQGHADSKTVNAIDQIRNLHRNPLMHPEDNLDGENAELLFSMCRNLIVFIMREMIPKTAKTA